MGLFAERLMIHRTMLALPIKNENSFVNIFLQTWFC